MLQFLERNVISVNEQLSFRKGLSTINAFSDFVNKVSLALDGSQSTIGLFCDLSKAFDCDDHSILIKKLSLYNS